MRAPDLGMAALKRIGRRSVVTDREVRWFPAIHGVAGCTFAPVGAMRKLSLVWIWLVAVAALVKPQRLLEISSGVALDTVHTLVFSQQREFGF